VVLVVLVAIMAKRRSRTLPEKTEILAAPASAAASATSTDVAPLTVNTTKTNGVSYTSEEAVAAMLKKFGAVASLYDFNPEVTNYSRRVVGPAKLEAVIAMTPTHIAQINNGRLTKIQSQIGGSDERRDPSVMKSWYAGPVVWSDQDAIAETMRILRAIGATETLTMIQGGKQEVIPLERLIPNEDGTRTTTTPFKLVKLSSKEGYGLVNAEYRMSAKGSDGLTVWFHLAR
jgi:hypothetical protein